MPLGNRRLSLSTLSLIGMIVMTVLPLLIVRGLWIISDVRTFRESRETLRGQRLEAQKAVLKAMVEEEIGYIGRERSGIEGRLTADLRSRVHEAESIAVGIYDVARNARPRREIEDTIISALEQVRFDEGESGFFIFDPARGELIAADADGIEGRGLVGRRDPAGERVLSEIKAVAARGGEGYYSYPWGKDSTRISYVKVFRPYGWYIGTGSYLSEMEGNVQQEFLKRVEGIRPGDGGMMLVGDLDGRGLLARTQQPDAWAVDGAEVLGRFASAARAGGGYVSHAVSTEDGGPARQMLGYAASVSEWGWFIASDMDVSGIEESIAAEAGVLRERIKSQIVQSGLFFTALLILILVPGRFILRGMDKNFAAFNTFLREAATGAARMDAGKLGFREFRELAESANAMTEKREAAEGALRESEERFRSLAAASFEGVAVSVDRQVVDVTPQLARMLGCAPEELLGQALLHRIHPEDLDMARRVARESNELPNQFRMVRKDGSIMEVESRTRDFLYKGSNAKVTVIRDISEYKEAVQGLDRLRAQLFQAQKMEAVGRLAGGVAHDFNNLLTAIIGYADFIVMENKVSGSIEDGIEEIRKAAEKAAALTQQLLAFSRKQILQPKVLDMNVLVANLHKMLTRLIGEDVHLISALDADHPGISADPSQIEQVIVNLAVNARDAMPDGGTITVGTGNVSVGAGGAGGPPDLKPGEYVILSVRDTGCGMNETVKSHLFEPFFTTKGVGKGTGLGLSTVYGIVKQSGGHISVESAQGKGSVFTVYLPQVPEETARGPAVQQAAEPGEGKGTLLLVEDEISLLTLTAKILERRGYAVLTASDPAAALDLLKKPDAPEVDLLITDVILPGMSGKDLAVAAGKLRPRMKVLFMSGYTDDAIGHHGVLDSGTAFLQKPFSPRALALKVREVLEGRSRGAGLDLRV